MQSLSATSAPKIPAVGRHRHKCDSCGFVWEHSNNMRGNREAHYCPCGASQGGHYDGCCVPEFSADGVPERATPRPGTPLNNRYGFLY